MSTSSLTWSRHPLSTTLAELSRGHGTQRLALHGLTTPDIARLIAAINDVDGVTRVAAVNGIKPSSPKTDESQESAESSEATTTGTCARSAPAFELVAAFDGVQVPDAASGAPVAPPATTPTSTATGETPEGPGSTETTAPDAGAEPAPGTVPGG